MKVYVIKNRDKYFIIEADGKKRKYLKNLGRYVLMV